LIVPSKPKPVEPTPEPAHALIPEHIAEDAALSFDEGVE